MRWIIALLLSVTMARAEGERPGDFDYYVLALSWSPAWCAAVGDARSSPQCDRDLGWVLHGLWPQYESGWPSECPSDYRGPSETLAGQMTDIMGDRGAVRHQWRRHGTCSGLDAEAFFDLSRQAYDSVARPQVLRDLDREVTLPASVIEEAFLEANPGLDPDQITITCRDGGIREARICLTRDLEPRTCGADVIRDCRLDDARFLPIDR